MAATDGYVRHRASVDVLDQDMWIAEDAEGKLYFPVRPSCIALEINPDTALATIREDSRLSVGLRQIRLPTAGGDQPLQCLASKQYAWWLALIDPRRFKAERRLTLEERQNALMGLAEEIMLRRTQLASIHKARQARDMQGQGKFEGHFACLKCGAPHYFCIDGAGWHLALGVEVN